MKRARACEADLTFSFFQKFCRSQDINPHEWVQCQQIRITRYYCVRIAMHGSFDEFIIRRIAAGAYGAGDGDPAARVARGATGAPPDGVTWTSIHQFSPGKSDTSDGKVMLAPPLLNQPWLPLPPGAVSGPFVMPPDPAPVV